jgi:hypothetical protein
MYKFVFFNTCCLLSLWLQVRPPALSTFKASLSKHQLPKSLDWRSTPADFAVKDQGQCGSCWVRRLQCERQIYVGVWKKCVGLGCICGHAWCFVEVTDLQHTCTHPAHIQIAILRLTSTCCSYLTHPPTLSQTHSCACRRLLLLAAWRGPGSLPPAPPAPSLSSSSSTVHGLMGPTAVMVGTTK